MSTLPEQFSAARKTQVEAQLEFFRKFSSKAVESTEKMIALNISTSRATLEKSADTVRQIFEAKDPRDLLALTAKSQENFDSLLAYGRELFSIAAAGARLDLGAAPAPASSAPQLTAVPTPAPSLVPTPAPAPVETLVEVQAEAIPEPVAEPTEIAKAVGKVAKSPAPQLAPELAAAPLPDTEIVVSSVEPVDAVAPTKAAKAKTLEIVTPKAGKKK